MRRRALIAAAGTVALAGCTASDESDRVDPDDYTVRGLEGSDVYHDATVKAPSLFDLDVLFESGVIVVALEFDPDAEYNPADHDVYLMDGERVVAEGNGAGDLSDGIYLIEFDIDVAALEQTQTFRVVSMNVTGPADEFDLEIVRTSDSE